MTGVIICIALYLAAQILARVVLGKGLNTLSMQEKGLFLDITASVRKWSLLFLVVIITAFLLASRFGQFTFAWMFSSYVAALLLFNNGVIVMMIWKKLKAAAMPEFFIKKFVLSSLIKLLAVIVVSAGVFYLIQSGKLPI
jgi:predicted signal transduction protein with EAL and GGDEF domain